MKKIVLSIATGLIALNGYSQIENFNGVSLGTFTNKGGNAAEFSTTATPPEGGSSTTCGYSKRDGSEWDNIQYTLTNNLSAEEVAALKNGSKKFKMNLATTASIGIRVLIKLESSNSTEYNSEYDVITTKGVSNQWEDLTFTLNGNVGNLANTDVNRLTIFFAIQGTGSTDQFFFDDLRIETVSSVEDNNNTVTASVFPNPTNDILNVQLPINGQVKASLLDARGTLVTNFETKLATGLYNGQVNVSHLQEGMYFLQLIVDGKNIKNQPIVVTK